MQHDEDDFRTVADRLNEQLHRQFWNGRYFTDWIHGSRRGGFSSDGNILAIFFGWATLEEAQQILAHIAERRLDTQRPLQIVDPVYSPWQVFPFYYLAGIPDYHRTLIWPWLGTVNAVNKARVGFRQEAMRDLARIGSWYVRDNVVAEVYEPAGRPVSRRFFQARVSVCLERWSLCVCRARARHRRAALGVLEFTSSRRTYVPAGNHVHLDLTRWSQ